MTDHTRQLRRALGVGLVLFVVFVLSITGYTLWILRSDAIQNGFGISEMHARNFESFLSQSLSAMDAALRHSVQVKNGVVALRETEVALSSTLRQTPYVRSWSLLDANSRIIVSSNHSNLGLTISLEKYLPPTVPGAATHFDVLRFGVPWSGRDFAVGKPSSLQEPVAMNAQSFIPILKGWDVDGTPVRLLIAINPDFYVNHMIQTLSLSEGTFEVLRYDGVLLMSNRPQAQIGQVQDYVTRNLHLEDEESGRFLGHVGEGQSELNAFRTSQIHPIVIVTQLPQAIVLNPWFAQAKALLAVVIPSLLGICFLVVVFFHRQKLYVAQKLETERLQRINATVFVESAEAIIITDAMANIISVNPAFSRITGYSPDDVIGKNPRLLASGRVEKTFYEKLWKELLEKGVWHGELVNRKKNGSLYDARLSITASRDSKGRMQHFIGDIWDITERHQAQAAVTESRNLLMSIINTAPMRVFWKDRESRYMGCNMSFATDAGLFGPTDVIGKYDYDLGWSANAEEYRADDRSVMESGLAKLSYDEPQSTPDGKTLWLRTSKVPLKNQHDEIVGVVGIYEDISEYKRTQNALTISEERFRSAFYLIPDALNINRLVDGRYVSVNKGFTQILGYTTEDVLGHSSLEFNIWNDVADRDRLVEGLLKHGSVSNLEAVFRAKDGHTVHGLMSASVIELEGVQHILSVTRDISERKKAEERLSLAASVFANSREGIMITALDGAIIDVNDAFTAITGYSRDDVLGLNPRILNSGRQGKEYYAMMWAGLLEKGHWYGEIWNRRKNGEVYAEMQTISTVRDSNGQAQHFVSLFSDISVYKEHQNQLEHIAHYDALTGLPNRVLLADRMRQGIAQVQRRGMLMAVAFLDLDGFKSVNDNHGHEAGDQLLITLSNRMKLALREGDTLARLGGDEFVAVLLDLPDAGSSVRLLTRLLDAASQPFMFGDILLQVSASLGVTFYPQADNVDADQLLRQADQAMYQAKLAGKNRYHVFDAELDRSVRGHHDSLENVRRALHAQEFELYYQPKVNMRTGKVIGAEALIRWRHPTRGLLAPGVFLPVIEDQPLAIELGEWVINAALSQVVEWRVIGLEIPVSVNIGARQLQQIDFTTRLRAMLTSHPSVRPQDLELEVLETSALEDLTHVSKVIEECNLMGVNFALDDFGTGYSSLTYLKQLPVAMLKIDQSFVRDMLIDPDDLAILEGTIGLASAFRRQVIAEGVESIETGKMLLQMGCEMAQGYAIAKPMPAHELQAWVANWQADPSWLNQVAVSRNNLPLLFAGVEHRAWVIALEHFLLGERQRPPPIDASECRMGSWLNLGGLDNHLDRNTVESVQNTHHEVHDLAVQILAAHANKEAQIVSELLIKLYFKRDSLLKQLQILLNSS